ncbi:DUF6153 family protein [Streptomyces sp. NPDC048603]|uniref:DUF6153 family protein n=1 Tax=Streptomyces sp. NPDC048603 TaxID=3365577 RepID=UPI00371109DC
MSSGKSRFGHHTGALLLATLFAVVFAVFAMHSLTTQQAHSCHTAALPLIGTADENPHAHTDVTSGNVAPGDATRTPDSPVGESPHDHGHDHDHGGTAETCLALLCVVAALLALALGRGPSERVLYVLSRGAASAHGRLSRTGAPPRLHQLSVLRC